MRPILSVVVGLWLLSAACIPTRRETYIRAPESVNIEDARNRVVTTYQQEEDYQYRLRPNDIISIRVASSTPSEFNFLSYQNDQEMDSYRANDPLLTGFDISVDGTIFLPVIGKIEVAGMTLDEAREKIREIVAEYLESPAVVLKLLSFQVTVLGEVEKEGTFVVYNPRLTVLDAIARAGGLTDFGDPETIKIVRNHVDSVEVAYVNVLEENIIASPYYYLRPDDIVSVGAVPGKNFQEYNLAYLQILLSSLTAVGIFFNIFD